MKKSILLALLLLFAIALPAQNAAEIDASFATEGWFGITGIVNKIAHRADGKIMVCGSINFYKGIPVNNIFCLNEDGSLDVSFDPGITFSTSVSTFAFQTDGKIIVAGNSEGTTVVKRLNANGSVDTSFNIPGAGFNSDPNCLAIQSDGKIIIGGRLSFFNGITFTPILRLNSDGSFDLGFDQDQGFEEVYSIIIQPSGKIVIAISSSSLSGNSCVKRLNLNGTVDSAFSSIIMGEAKTLSVQSDEKIIIGGNLRSSQTLEVLNVMRITSNGLLDSTFNIGIVNRVTQFPQVNAVAIQPDGKILIAGFFSSYNQIPANNIVRINTNGNIDNSFNSGTGFNYILNTLDIHSNTTFFTGGNFTYYDTTNADSILLLNSNGTINPIFDIGSTVYIPFGPAAFCAQDDGKVIVVGDFNHYNNVGENHILRLNSDGSKDSAFNVGSGFLWGTGNGTRTSAIAQQLDEKIIVGGLFDSYNGTSVNNLIRLNTDGSIDASFNNNSGLGWVNLVTILSDGKMLVYGLGNGFVYQILRLNQDGTIDPSFSSTAVFDSFISSIKVQSNGKILVVGSFSTFNSITANCIVRLNPDGTLDNTFVSGSGFIDFFRNIRTLAVQQDGKIIVGGRFTSYNGTSNLKNFIRLNTDGTIDPSFNIGTSFNSMVSSIVIDSGGRILVGGFFTSYNGTSCNRLIRLFDDGTVDSQFNTGTGFNSSTLLGIQELQDTKIMAVGGFSNYNGVDAKQIIRLRGNSVLGTINNSLVDKMTLYSNPTKDILQVKLDDLTIVKSYAVFDSTGKEIKSETTSNFRNKIDVTDLSKGIYLLKVETNQGQFVEKFIKE